MGCGQIGRRHAAIIHSLGILKAVCDSEKNKADELAQQYDCLSFESLSMMLSSVDADCLAICTPNGLHKDHTLIGLQHHLHIICEKPMALRTHDCQQMIDAAIAAEKKLFVVKQNRFNAPVQAVKKLLDEERLGKIFSIQLNAFWNRSATYYAQSNWRGSKDLDGGILFTQFSHFIDLICWWMGDVNRIYTLSDNYLHQGITSFEDTVVVLLEFINGAIGTCHFTTGAYEKNKEGSITLFGSEGTIQIGGQYLNKLVYQVLNGNLIQIPDDSGLPNDYGFYTGSMSNHDKMYKYILENIDQGPLIPDATVDALKTVSLIERIYQSTIV